MLMRSSVWLAVAAAFAPIAQAPQTVSTTDPSAQVDALLARFVHADTPGAAVIVMQKGRVLHQKGYGLSELTARTPISPRTVFDVASVAKPLTAMAALILVDQGKLQHTDTLGKFFPEFPVEARPITVRQLLTHTSGLMDYTQVWGETRRLRGSAPRTMGNLMQFLSGQRLRFQPGERWEYSNSNYAVLAQIVSMVSGQPFPQFARDRIFKPLGMDDSFVYDGSRTTNQAMGYLSQGQLFVPIERNPENYVYGDGQLNSTIGDLGKWMIALSSGTIVSAPGLQEAFTPARTNDGTAVNYGFGWGLGRYRGLSYVGHGGNTDGFVAQVTRFPAQDFSVVVLSNNEHFPPPYAIANKIASIYLTGELKAPSPVSVSANQLRDLAGAYDLYGLTLKIQYDENALWLSASGQKRARLLPLSADEFVAEGSDGATSVQFARNLRGRVTAISLLDQNGTMLWRR